MESRLVCPQCQCPISPPSGKSQGMPCPRCNTWLDLDPLCQGSCIACYKTHSQESPGAVQAIESNCADVSEKSSVNVVQRNEWTGASKKDRSFAQAWKDVLGKVFNVR